MRGIVASKKTIMETKEKEYEWVSVSEAAKRSNCSSQLIYLRIKEGMYETQEFTRGSMRGWLVRMPKL